MQPRRAVTILAGGRSIRMGQPKEWLDVGGQPLLQRVVAVAQQACPTVVVVAAVGQSLPELPEAVLRLDDPPARTSGGPLTAVLTALETLEPLEVEATYLGAGDALMLSVGHVRHVLDALDSDAGYAAAVPETEPRADGRRILHGLSGAVQVGPARKAALSLLKSGQRALHSLYEALDAKRLSVASLPAPEVVEQCNTPEQWSATLARWEARQ